jgi:hypothetical protein
MHFAHHRGGDGALAVHLFHQVHKAKENLLLLAHNYWFVATSAP